ncbi:MAG: nitrite/sulfite reductase [Chloroflexota bacterium]|nr:nitrite/sulfite reductase [Chloroflexota bacterium]
MAALIAGVLEPLQCEIDEFEAKAKAFRAGEMAAADFRAWRLTRGIYGQRQPDNQMVRVKIPFGGLTADQLDVFGSIAEHDAGSGKAHLTTRQNVQFHFVKLETVPEIMRLLAEVGLTTREAASNTVRNVTACPLAGVDATEPFDITPYAAAFARYFLRKPENQALPRKFKVAFSGCAEDCALTPIHDIGYQAVINDGQSGFRVVVGGGLSTMPRLAPCIVEFIGLDRYLILAEAILRVFDRTGNRENKAAARMKFVVEKIGFGAFKALVDEELAQPWAKKTIALEPLLRLPDEPKVEDPPFLPKPLPDFPEWRRTNVVAQKQPGYFSAFVTVPAGDLKASQLRALADIARRHNGGFVRTTITQNLVLRWLRPAQLAALHKELCAIGLGALGAHTLTDVVSCSGAASCSLAITASPEMAYGLAPTVAELKRRFPEAEHVTIKISGCPNGCGQHHMGAIGFAGASTNQNHLQVPSYEVWVGGGLTPKGVRLAARIGKVAAKRVPIAIERLISAYSADRQASETFYDWLDRSGLDRVSLLIQDLREVGPLQRDLDAYRDWGSDAIYRVMRGEGECA